MAECKDCIHFCVCSPYTAPNESYPEVDGCKCFRATADVVQKSEVEKLKAELEHYHKANLRQSLIIGQIDLTHRQFLKELDEIFKEHKEGFYCDWYLYSRYDELKNKYKEQKENGSDDERPNRRNV